MERPARRHERHELKTRPLEAASTGALLSELASESKELVRKEVELATAEIKRDLQAELAAAKKLGVAGLCGLLVLTQLLVAATLSLAAVLPGWAAALAVAGPVAVVGGVAGALGWSQRVRKPIPKTVKTLEENVQWAKERFA